MAFHFGNIDNLISATSEQLAEAPEVGDKIAGSLIAFFKEAKNQKSTPSKNLWHPQKKQFNKFGLHLTKLMPKPSLKAARLCCKEQITSTNTN